MTYRRFLDLQKAEAQAREAQIQLALERVRARTMAMHKSEELAETAQVHVLSVTGTRRNSRSYCYRELQMKPKASLIFGQQTSWAVILITASRQD